MQMIEWTIWTRTVFFLSLLCFVHGFLFFNVFSAFAGTSLLIFLLSCKYGFEHDCGDIQIKRSILETNLYVNHPCHVKTEIHHHGGPIILSVTDSIPSSAKITKGDNHTSKLSTRATPMVLSYQLTFFVRGEQTFPPLSIQMADRLHLFTKTLSIPIDTSLIVHSDPKDVSKAMDAPFVSEDSLILPNFIGADSSLEFEGLREFLPGDLLRNIDWKASSRLQTLVSKVFEKKEIQKTMILLDVSRSMRRRIGKLGKLDHAIGIALQLAHMLQSIHHPVGLIAYDEHKIALNIPPSFDYHQIFSACSQLPSSITVSSYHMSQPDTNKEKKYEESLEQQHFLSLISPFLLGGRKAVKNRIQATGIYQAVSSFFKASSSLRLIFITDLETHTDALRSTIRYLDSNHHTIWLLTLFSPLYDEELKQRLTVDHVEKLYSLQQTQEKTLHELKKHHIEIVDITPLTQGLEAVKIVQRR